MSLIRYISSEHDTEAGMALPTQNDRAVASRDHQDTEVVSGFAESSVMEFASRHKVYIVLLAALALVAGVAVAATTDLDTLGWMWRAGWWR